MEEIGIGIVWYLIFVFAAVFHEAAHSWVSLKLGDPTAYKGGQVSLDPLPHIKRSPFGMVVIPLICVFTIGWPIGFASAPYDPLWASRHPRKAAKMAIAGPLSNLSLIILAVVLIRLGLTGGFFEAPDSIKFSQIVDSGAGNLGVTLSLLLSMFFSMNLILFVLNIIPLPPLDGFNALPLFLKDETAVRLKNLMTNSLWQLLGLLLVWHIFPEIFSPIWLFAVNLIFLGMPVQYG